MKELYLLSGLLISAGLYISYQWTMIRKYRMALSLATFALEQAYVAIMEDAGGDREE